MAGIGVGVRGMQTMPSSKSPPGARLNINVNRGTREAIAWLQEHDNVTVTEAVRRLIAVGVHILRAQADGAQIIIQRNGDEPERVTLLR
jgi:hypothetical protein